MMERNQLLQWIIELQSLAQAGLTYGRDVYDLERYQRIRDLSAEMLASLSELPLERVKGLFCNEKGYQTPKIDTRAALFRDGRILLVQENDGRWSMPGGWCDVDQSVGSNTIKEVREEAGVAASADRIIAVQDRSRHNEPQYAYGVCKIFVQCSLLRGEFAENSETVASDWFLPDALPPLSEEKNTAAQIRMCFDALEAGDSWRVLFD